MIVIGKQEHTEEIKKLWQICFPNEDERYLDYYMKNVFKPENCLIKMYEGKIVSVLVRNKHALMFNGRALQVSMIQGVATHPDYQNKGFMHELMEITMDACEHSELLTLIQSDNPKQYEKFGFRTIYERAQYKIGRNDVKRVTNFGISFDPSPIDLLKVYSAYIKRFNGFYARDLHDFVNYKKQITMLGGKIVAYYNGKNQIQGYAAMIPNGDTLRIDELTYLDSMSLMKLCNAALQEKRVVVLDVSKAEDLSKIFPNAQTKTYGSTMAKLNDAQLFTKLFNQTVRTVGDAFAISQKPLNLNEAE